MKVGREIMSNVECWCGVAAGQALPSSMVSLLCSQWIGHVNSLIHFFPFCLAVLCFFSQHIKDAETNLRHQSHVY